MLVRGTYSIVYSGPHSFLFHAAFHSLTRMSILFLIAQNDTYLDNITTNQADRDDKKKQDFVLFCLLRGKERGHQFFLLRQGVYQHIKCTF